MMMVALACGTAGLCLGVVLAEWRLRDAARAELREARVELSATLSKINVAHNGLAAQIERMQDQLSSHEMKLSAAVRK